MVKLPASAVGALLLLAGAAAAQPAKTGSTPSGPVLQTPAGMTLYVYDGDKQGVSKTSECNDKCAEKWPPFRAEAGAKTQGDWTIVTRKDGAKQWAYKDRPLYTFEGDKAAGQTNGIQMNGNTWHAAAP